MCEKEEERGGGGFCLTWSVPTGGHRDHPAASSVASLPLNPTGGGPISDHPYKQQQLLS